jgi:hypothetical protein
MQGHVEGEIMQSATQTAPVSTKLVWVGRILSALAALFLFFDGAIKLPNPSFVQEASAQLGYPVSLAPGLGILLLVCTIVYVIPRTSVVGAILLTGYLGGATASHVRIGADLFPILFPSFVGALIWGGLLLREDRLRALILPRS